MKQEIKQQAEATASLSAEMKQNLEQQSAELKGELSAQIKHQSEELGGKLQHLKEEVDAKINEIREEYHAEVRECRSQVQECQSAVDSVRQELAAIREQISGTSEVPVSPVPSVRALPALTGSDAITAPSPAPRVKLSSFDGQSSWSTYRTQFEVVAKANGWTEVEKASHLAAALRSPAADILQTIPEEKRLCYESLTAALELRFGDSHMQQLHCVQLNNRRQKANETLQELASDIERLVRLAYPGYPSEIQDRLALEKYVSAINDAELQQNVRMADCTTLRSAVVHAMKFESIRLAAGSGQRRAVRQVTTAEIDNDNIRRLVMEEIRKLGGWRKRSASAQIRCWACGKVGHVRAECTERHGDDATASPRAEAPKIIAQATSLQGMENGLLAEGFIEGRRCRMIVDTGANVTLIRPDVLQEMHPRPRWLPGSAGIRLQTVTGDSAAVHGKVDLLFQIGSKRLRHQVYIADIVDECILGLDILRKHGFVVDLKESVLRCPEEDIILIGRQCVAHSQVKVVLKSDVTVPGRSECVVPGCVQSSDQHSPVAVVEPANSGTHPQSLLVARALVRMCSDYVPVRLINLCDSTRTLKKGTEVAVCEPVVAVVQGVTKADAQHHSPVTSLPPYLRDLVSEAEIQPSQKEAVARLLRDFSDVFSSGPSDFGRTDVVEHRIDTGDHAPIRQAPRRLPLAKRGEMERLIAEMAQQDVIEPSASPWASPVVLVKKKDGSTRFCVDYRRLNDITKKDSYPLPRIDDTLDTLAQSQWFSTLDLRSGYWQVALDPKDKEKTAFTAGNGLWQFNVMPFGLCNAPATFERLMESVLRGLSWEICLIYLDDVIVMGRSFHEHLENLRKVFQRLKEARLKLSPAKCQLFRKQVHYLGHIVTTSGVKTDPEKIQAVQSWPIPENVTQLRSFLGLCSYYRRFVKGFSIIARPLHRLTEGNREFKWDSDCEAAFQQLKQALTSAPVLAYPRAGEQFILDTDASNTGIGAVLSQNQDGQEKVIAYFSRSLSKPEKNYCVTRRELLAVVKAIEHFHHYLYGQEFLLRTDHASLQWLFNFKNPEGQIARWIQRLQEYNFKTLHRAGKSHGNADALSRRPCPEHCTHCRNAEKRYNPADVTTIRQAALGTEEQWTSIKIRESQLGDDDIRPLLTWKESDGGRPDWGRVSPLSPATKTYWAQWDSLHVRDGCLYRKFEDAEGKNHQWQLVLPRERVKAVLEQLHNSPAGGHFGVNKTLAKVRERFYWSGCRKDVEQWCRKCDECVARKGPSTRGRGRMRQYNVGAPFERLAIDVMGPLPRTERGNRHILVIMDYFTKWPEVFPIPDQEAVTVADVLVNNVISRFGVPLELHSDQGRNFESEVFSEMCRRLGIKKTRTTPLHPRSNGMVERHNRTIQHHLSHFVSDHQDDWDKCIPLFLLAYRSAVHETTGETPAMMTLGRELRLPCDLLFGRPEDPPEDVASYVDDLVSRMQRVHHFARAKIAMASDRMKARYDVRSTDVQFKEGDQVWLYNPSRKKGLSPKLQRHWEGPFHVMTRINDVIYRIRRRPSAKPKVVHIDRLAPYSGEVSSRVHVRDEHVLEGGSVATTIADGGVASPLPSPRWRRRQRVFYNSRFARLRKQQQELASKQQQKRKRPEKARNLEKLRIPDGSIRF